jgi:molybdenum cofactor cytidylyltransferase
VNGGALVLAAGFGRRFGSDKRVFAIEDGTPMLLHTLARYREAFDDVTVVLREDDQVIAQQVAVAFPNDTPAVVTTRLASLGMAHSLSDGIRGVIGWRYAFIALADMPFVQVRTLCVLRARMEAAIARGTAAIVQPCHGARPGHPVGFSHDYFTEMSALTGDRGARPLLDRHRDAVLRVEVDDDGVLVDVDTPEDHHGAA